MKTDIRCLIVDDEPTAREILEHYLKQVDGLAHVQSCANALEAFKVLDQKSVDLILLDINMPDISGISLARAIGDKAKVIFTTAYREYAVDGFDLQAVDYLLKPISLQRFIQAIEKYKKENAPRAQESSGQSSSSTSLLIKADRKTVKIPLDEISHIESLGDYLKIHTQNGVQRTRETISALEKKLNKQQFIRIHRSFIVSLKAITAFSKEEVELGEIILPISRSFKAEVHETLQGVD